MQHSVNSSKPIGPSGSHPKSIRLHPITGHHRSIQRHQKGGGVQSAPEKATETERKKKGEKEQTARPEPETEPETRRVTIPPPFRKASCTHMSRMDDPPNAHLSATYTGTRNKPRQERPKTSHAPILNPEQESRSPPCTHTQRRNKSPCKTGSGKSIPFPSQKKKSYSKLRPPPTIFKKEETHISITASSRQGT